MERLPSELVHDIFCRLPIAAIMRCKRVCKAWEMLLSHPYFGNWYLKNNTPPKASFFISQYTPRRTDVFRYWISLTEITQKGEVFQTFFNPNCLPNYVGEEGRKIVHLVGSCNGLLCLYLRVARDYLCWYDTVYIINPLVREVKIALPTCKMQATRGEYYFGFAASGFKVLRILPDAKVAEIFTVGVDDGWRCLDDDLLFRGMGGVVSDGAYHFILFRRDGFVDSMHSFDLREEKRTRISLPQDLRRMKQSSTTNFKYTVLNNRLFVSLLSPREAQNITIWTRKGYGVAESWTKDVVSITNWCTMKAHLPVAMLPDGEILFSVKDREYLVFHDPKQQTYEKTEVCDPHWAVARVSTTYVPRFSEF